MKIRSLIVAVALLAIVAPGAARAETSCAVVTCVTATIQVLDVTCATEDGLTTCSAALSGLASWYSAVGTSVYGEWSAGLVCTEGCGDISRCGTHGVFMRLGLAVQDRETLPVSCSLSSAASAEPFAFSVRATIRIKVDSSVSIARIDSAEANDQAIAGASVL